MFVSAMCVLLNALKLNLVLFVKHFLSEQKGGKCTWKFDPNLFETYPNHCWKDPVSATCIEEIGGILWKQIDLGLFFPWLAIHIEYSWIQFSFAWILQISIFSVYLYIHYHWEVSCCTGNFVRRKVIPDFLVDWNHFLNFCPPILNR